MIRSNKPQYSICKICKVRFARQSNILRPVCFSHDCMTAYGLILLANKKKKDKKGENKKDSDTKKSLLTHSDYIQLFQKVFNTYIRFRDKDLPCISCGTTRPVAYDAGHFWSAGKYQFLRFNEDNVHKQCSFTCNKNKSGNLLEYRPALIKKIGLERVEWLDENRSKLLDITIPEIQEKIKEYKLKIKDEKNRSI